MTHKTISLECKFRVYVDGVPFLGIGRIELLERIMEYGSISKAAASMKMSYKKSWQLIKEMNALADSPIVVRQTGGAQGGGAQVTPQGIALIQRYRTVLGRLDMFLDEAAHEFTL